MSQTGTHSKQKQLPSKAPAPHPGEKDNTGAQTTHAVLSEMKIRYPEGPQEITTHTASYQKPNMKQFKRGSEGLRRLRWMCMSAHVAKLSSLRADINNT